MKVLIVGAGMAGLACAATLDKEKYDITVIDKTDKFGTIGYAISLWNNGIRILNRLDINLKDKINTIDYVVYRDSHNRLISIAKEKDFALTYDMITIVRSDLHQSLLEKVKEKVKYKMSTNISNIENIDNGVWVTFKDMNSNDKDSAESRESFDIVIGADGIRSTIRENIFPNKIKKYGYKVWLFWNKQKTNRPIIYLGRGSLAINYNSVNSNAVTVVSKNDESVKLSKKESLLKVLEKFDISLKEEVLSIDEKDIFEDDVLHVDLTSYISKRIILIGDAAHGFSPLLGMGTTLALEDGYMLASKLNEIVDSKHIDMALKNYNDERIDYIDSFRQRIFLLEKIYLTDWKIFVFLRDLYGKIFGVTLLEKLIYKYLR